MSKNLKRPLERTSDGKSDVTPSRELVKERINQDAFEMMLRAKDILSKRIPAKKKLARIQNIKCKVYVDKERLCDIIHHNNMQRKIPKRNVEMKEINKEELISECIKRMRDMKTRIIKIKAIMDDKEIILQPIVLFGRSDAIILGKESEKKLTLLQERWREQIYPMKRSEEHIQFSKATTSNQRRKEEAREITKKPGTFKYVSMSRYYGDLKEEMIDLDTYNYTDIDNTEDGKDMEREDKIRRNNLKEDRNKTIKQTID